MSGIEAAFSILVGVLAAVLSFSSSPPLPGLPVLDADGLGRAFPELQMYLPFILGSPPYPACLADNKGEVVAISHCASPKALEDVLRTEVVRMG